MKTFLSFVLFFSISSLFAKHHEILHLPGNDDPEKGKTIVLVAGDEEYRTEESMPMLAKILSQKHGFRVQSTIPVGQKREIYRSPIISKGVRGWHHLKDADLMLIGTRFRRPSAEEAKHVTEFLNAGKPVIGIRTSTHAFTGSGSFGEKISYGQFGPLIMGEGWVSHHGRHKVEGARGIVEAKNAAHPILKGVTDVFGPSDVYGINRLTDEDTILMRGAGDRYHGP
jgi:type 1 glutamine amidotransferase